MNICDLAIEEACVCPVENCKKEFKSSSQLSMHVLRHHDGCKLPIRMGQGSEYYCPVDGCTRGKGKGQPFPRLGQLKQHYHSVHGNKEYSCERCGKSFGLKDVCARHQAECGTVFQCNTCNDTFHSRNALYQHAKRKKHQLPSGSKIRANYSRPKKTSTNSPHSTSAPTIIVPITLRQVVRVPSHPPKSSHASTQTDPEPAPITTASQTTQLTQYTDASTQLIDLQLPTLPPFSDASTNTTSLDCPVLDSSFDQLIDASTNTLPLEWADPISRALVDAGTSTACGSMEEQTEDLATQTNIADFLCDLSTQTDLTHVPFDIGDSSEHGSRDFLVQSHDSTTECNYKSRDSASGPDFNMPVDFHFPVSTRDMSTSTSLPTVDFGVGTSDELDEISQLLGMSRFNGFSAAHTSHFSCHGDENLSDLGTQTHVQNALDSWTQTCLFSESGTQTVGEIAIGTESGTQTCSTPQSQL